MAANDMMGIVMIGVLLIGGFFILNQQPGGLAGLLGGNKEEAGTGAGGAEEAQPTEQPAEGAEGQEGMGQEGQDQMGQYPGMPGMPGYPMPGMPGPYPPMGGGIVPPRYVMCQQRFNGSCNKECAYGPNPICQQCMSVCGPPRAPVPRPAPLPLPYPRPPVSPCARFCFGPGSSPVLCRRCTDAQQSRFGPAIAGARAYPASVAAQQHRWQQGKHYAYAYGQPGGAVNPHPSAMGMQRGGPHSKAFYGRSGCGCGR